jgi:hypothetical protein
MRERKHTAFTKELRFRPTPLLLTHWDPDLYPARPIPLLQELIVHILAHGAVLLKDVDLFLNPRIRNFLSSKGNRDIFTSLVDTRRIRLLIPDEATSLLLDPLDHPLLATAMSRSKTKPLKNKLWTSSRDTERYCADLDNVFGRPGRAARSSTGIASRDSFCRRRVTPPAGENQFAAKLREVLSQRDKRWKRRKQFKGITQSMARRFVAFCEDHELALQTLAEKGISPNAKDGFYRSLAYQCADLFPHPGRQAMKNLVQSVYAYCELKRERASGSYSGDRLAEMPPDREMTEQIVRIEVTPLQGQIDISMIPNIGDVISAVLEECEPSLKVFWKLAGKSASPQEAFQAAWGEVATAFAKYGSKYARIPIRSSASRLRTSTELVLKAATLGIASVANTAGIVIDPSAADVVSDMITTVGGNMVDSVRADRIKLKGSLKREVYESAAIRCSRIA